MNLKGLELRVAIQPFNWNWECTGYNTEYGSGEAWILCGPVFVGVGW